jgi:two-component system KDP operon response regulator KdpE
VLVVDDAALRAAADSKPDVIVLDLGLPDLDAGADDYVTKPFGMDELLARLRAAVRRATSPVPVPGDETAVVTTASFTVDLAARKVQRNGIEVHLTPTEWGLLEILVRNPGRLVAQQQLPYEVWGPGHTTETHGSIWRNCAASWSRSHPDRAT